VLKVPLNSNQLISQSISQSNFRLRLIFAIFVLKATFPSYSRVAFKNMQNLGNFCLSLAFSQSLNFLQASLSFFWQFSAIPRIASIAFQDRYYPLLRLIKRERNWLLSSAFEYVFLAQIWQKKSGLVSLFMTCW